MSRFSPWLRRTFSTGRRTLPGPRFAQPQLELLEARLAPSASITLQGNGVTIDSYVAVGFQQNEVAALTGYVNNQVDPNAGDYSAQINWGDGQSSAAVIALNTGGSGGEFVVKGSHVYSQPGTLPITVQATGPSGSTATEQTSQDSAAYMPSGIAGAPPPTGTASLPPSNVVVNLEGNGVTLTSYAGVGFQENEVATVGGDLNGPADAHVADFHAWINWGDSAQWFPADLAPNTGGSGFAFQVKGSHVYATAAQDYPVVVYATGPDGTSTSQSTSQADVSDMPSGIAGTPPPTGTASLPPSNVVVNLEGNGVTLTSYAGVGFQENEVATVGGDLNGPADAHVADFHAWINWGDSAQWFPADLAPNTGGSGFAFQVKGSHVYATAAQDYPVVVYATGPDGTSTSQSTSQADVSDMPSGIAGTPPPTGTASLPPSNVVVNLEGNGVTLVTQAGVGLQGSEVATVGGDLNGPADTTIADFQAWINWGDSAQWFPADLAPNTGSGFEFQVKGDHVYEKAAQDYPIVVYAVGPDGTSVSSQTTQADVSANPNPIGVSLTAPDVTDANAASEVPYSFQLTFQAQGNNLVSGSSVNGATVQVVAPNGEAITATLVSTTPSGDAATITANYQITPLNGSWTSAPLGTYTVTLGGAPVTDLAGDVAPQGNVGTFQANVAIKLIAQVPQYDDSVPAGGTFPLNVTAEGASGATDTSVNGPATVLLNGKVVATVNLQNGSGSATIPAGTQTGADSIQVQVTTPHYLQGSASVTVEANESESNVKEVFSGTAENAEAVADVLKELLEGTYQNASEAEEAAKEQFEALAKKLGGVAKGLSFVPLALDLGALYNDLNVTHNQEQFGKDFSDAIKDSLLLGINWGVGIVTDTNPVGAVGGLILNSVIDKGAEAFYKNYLQKGYETAGQNLFSALTGSGNSVLLSPGTAVSPGAGDPPPSIILVNPAGGTAGAANLSAAGQAVYAPVGVAFSGVVATFLDATGNTNLAAYSAYIAWGDGNFTPATVASLPGGGFSVSGSDAYTTPGIYTVTVVVSSSDGSTTASYNSAIVYPAGPGGSTPTATLLAPSITSENADFEAPYTFSVVYQDSGMISAGSLAAATLQLQPPTGPALTAVAVGAQAVGRADALGDAAAVVVTYQVMPPGGNWYAAPPGTYTVVLGGGSVTDRAGHAITAGQIGSFQVAAPPTLTVSGLERIQVGTGAGIVNATNLTLTGYAEAGSTVKVYNGATLLRTVAAGADGSWTYNYTAPQDGTYDFTVTAVDGVGNTSAPSADALIAVDVVPPTSSVAALPATSSTTFTVSWSGQDDPGGTGVAAYSIYVSDNGGPFTAWLTDTTLTSSTFQGANGHTYGFYSVAVDGAGNVQATPTAAQATTTATYVPFAVQGNVLTVNGTAGNDTFTFAAGSPEVVTLNGTSFNVPAAVTVIQFQGDGGNDRATLTGGSGGNSLSLSPGGGTLSGAGYAVSVSGVATVIAIDQAGNKDTADLSDAGHAGANTFTATTTAAYFNSPNNSFFNEAVGFHTVVASAAAGGTDLAVLFGAASGTGSFTGLDGTSYLSTLATFAEAVGFPVVVANSIGGHDTATLFDAGGGTTNQFIGTSTQGYLYDSTTGRLRPKYFNEANAFQVVVARATPGASDTATLFDGSGTNTFYAYPTFAYLTGSGYFNEVVGFPVVAVNHVVPLATDVAYFTGSGGADAFTGTPTSDTLQGSNFLYTVLGFRAVAASEAGGAAAANLIDNRGGATYSGSGAYGLLAGQGYSIALSGFSSVAATALDNVADHLNLEALDYVFSATPPADWQ